MMESGFSMLVSGSISSIMTRPSALKSLRSISLLMTRSSIILSPTFPTTFAVSSGQSHLGVGPLPILIFPSLDTRMLPQ